MNAIIRSLCAALALASLTAAAQDAGTPKPAAAPAVAPAAAAAPPPPAVSLDDAYRKEFAFLEAQKRELQARIAEVEQRFNRDRSALEGEVSALEGRALDAQTAAEDATAALQKADQMALANADNSDLLSATFEQARATLDGFGDTRLNSDEFAAAEDAVKVQTLFTTAVEVLDRFTKVQREEGSFFLADGTEVAGQVIRFGNIAAFGVSPQGSGALAPVGGGRFRLWPSPSEDSAKALEAGKTPALLQAFIFENPNAAVPEPEVKTAWSEAKKGGLIGYIILLLGAIAMGLVVLRAVFLHRAGASIHNILDAIAPAMKAHRIEEAIDAAKRFKGSAARVVTAALRGIQQALGDNVLDRSEREHLEDIVSESILHESTHLSRFGSVIMMVAAVAPLLGLLGTVTGMIQTFDVITEFGTSDPKLLSGGISTALVTTELGLIVAIPCLLFGNLLNGWAERIKDDMEKAALRAINLFQGNVAPRVTG
jgi:biopolymer transport protein ExbB